MDLGTLQTQLKELQAISDYLIKYDADIVTSAKKEKENPVELKPG